MGKRVGFFYHPDLSRHRSEYTHPERPERLIEIVEHLQTSEFISQLIPGQFDIVDEKWLGSVHTQDHIGQIRATRDHRFSFLDQGDTYANEHSYSIAKRAVGACLTAGDQVLAGELDRAFCCIRPPGHHAESARPMGFCLFNNVAVLGRYLQAQGGLERVAIIDWDVHHGNGTQDIFYGDASVFYFSVHQYPFYPGTGHEAETGVADGVGYTLNRPVAAGSDDDVFMSAINDYCLPALDEFSPELILISAGFDAHLDDPLGGCRMTSTGFAAMTESIVAFADRNCQGRVISVLEGGYELTALAQSVEQHLIAMQA